MKIQTYGYLAEQLKKVSTVYSEFLPKIKIIKPDGETNWLNITEEQLQKISIILLS